MTSKKSSRNLFLTMFGKSVCNSCIASIFALVIGLFYLITNFIDIVAFQSNYFRDSTGFFFNDFCVSGMTNIFLVIAGLVTALILFSFQWSKKSTNVIYSFGMSKKEIYFARLLAGLAPMALVFTLLTLLETLNNGWAGFTPDARYWAMVFYTMFTWYSVYALSFMLCSVVFICTGNMLEGILFCFSLSWLPTVINIFLNKSMYLYTLGASQYNFNAKWHWSTPFFLEEIRNEFYGNYSRDDSELLSYFDKLCEYKLTLLDFSSAITAFVLAVALVAIGLYAFKKHKNEIAGTWGRGRTITEVVAAVLGFYVFTLVTEYSCTFVNNKANGTLMTFILCMLMFCVVMLIFKLIFSHKRKTAIKQTLVRIPLYTVGMGVVTLVFSFGMFGYSSYIPDASKIESVSLSVNTNPYEDVELSDSSMYGFKDMMASFGVYGPETRFVGEDVKDIVKLHKSIVADGKIKNNAPNACSCPVMITYTLKNGNTVKREYVRSTEETVRKIMAVGDMGTVKDKLEYSFEIGEITSARFDELLKLIKDKVSESFSLSENWEVLDENSDSIGYLYCDNDEGEVYFFNEITGEERYLGKVGIVENDYSAYNFFCMYESNCYLYPTDMRKGYNIGCADEKLIEALKKDIVAQSVADYYLHKPADEIGIISFGMSKSSFGNAGDGYMYGEEDGINFSPEEPEKNTYGSTAWNINSGDIKAVVITKSMKNTVKYLEENDLMKYMDNKTTVADVKSIKVATTGELYGEKNKSSILPIFYGAYWPSEAMRAYDYGASEIYYHYLFGHVEKSIADKDTISKVLENTSVFGFCPNDYRIVEITYTDGAVGTVLLSENAYNSIFS